MKAGRPVVIVGVGGFGRETADVLEAAARTTGDDVALLGFADDSPSPRNLERLERRGFTYLGPVDELLTRDVDFVVAVGAPRVRSALAAKLEAGGLRARTLVHPHATVGSEVFIGSGSVICAGARVATNVTLGSHTHVNANATVGHDTICDDYVSINPGALISGDCRIGACSLIGVGASVLQGLTIGKGVTVGGSACVTRPVPDGLVVKGVPAR